MKRDVKRFFILGLFSIFLISFAISVVSAATNAEVVASSIATWLETVKLNPASLSSILLGVLLWIILYSIVKQIFGFEGGRLAWLAPGAVSLIIVIITFLYLPSNFIEAIALQYGAMGATILTIIPFVIMIYFTAVVSNKLIVARAIWIFYTVYYFTMFLYKVASSTEVISADNIPYFGAMIVGTAMIFIVGYMREKVFTAELDSKEEAAMKAVKVRGTLRKVQNKEAAEYDIWNIKK
ncbi:MAG: hypothetical protein ABH840_00960 [Nanoarchaeota archaeon]